MSLSRVFSAGLVCLLVYGCPGAAFESPKDDAPAVEVQPATPNENPAAEPVAEEAPRQNALQREAKLVDRRAFLQEHPDAVEREKNVINASDPISAASQGYFAGVSSLMISAYEHDLQLQKQLNDNKWPSFDAYKTILDTHGVKLKGLKKGQVYAYDDQTGQITILELPEGEEVP
ncbi:MAG: hypothetical protein KDA75_11045 [Planctomycetaceae bacterium]|nr:hypothetical protein [Planctomycetaceae bacterium]